jgi:hypothetical protein
MENSVLMDNVLEQLTQMETIEADLDNRKVTLSNYLVGVRNELGSSFTYKGQKYQIRFRSGNHYICAMGTKK